MSAHPCGGCSRPVTDAYLCPDCTETVRDRLYGVRALVDELEVALCRMARVTEDGSGLRAPSAETPLAFNWEAAEALWMLHRTMTDWSRRVAATHHTDVVIGVSLVLTDPKDPARIFPPRGRSAGSAAWLAEHISWLANLPAASDVYDQILYAVDHASRTIDRPAERAFAGPCGEDTEDGVCEAELYAPRRSHRVRCPGCGAEHDMEARRSWLLDQAQYVRVTAVEASRALPALLARQVTASMIRGYAARGKLNPAPGPDGVGRGPNGRPAVFYLLGDIVAVLGADEAERETRKSRHPAPRPSPRRSA